MNVGAVNNVLGMMQSQPGTTQKAAEGSLAEESHESAADKAREQQAASTQATSTSAPSTQGAGKMLNVVA